MRLGLLSICVFFIACDDPSYSLSREELLNPQTCEQCHPVHYQQWSGSMHAYAADDPVFLAMNERGQAETDGELGSFCIQCHAPMAVRDGLTDDGLNADELPTEYKGITCYFCHTVDAVEGEHNNPLRLAEDLTMRGRYSDTRENGAHRTAYSPLHDSRQGESSALCGACHDIVTPAGVHLERTYAEFKESIFSQGLGGINVSCGTCHMFGEDGPIADFPGVGERTRYEHTMAGIDLALTPWPEKEAQRTAIERDLRAVLSPRLCVNPGQGGIEIEYTLENINAGHSWPSGASGDRRAWAEVRAYEGEAEIFSSGVVGDDQSVVEAAAEDLNFWQIRDYLYDENGDEAHMFWDVRSVESELLTASVTIDRSDPRFIHSLSRTFSLLGQNPDRVQATVFIRAVGRDVLSDLVDTGHLDPALADGGPTLQVESATLSWSAADGFGCKPN